MNRHWGEGALQALIDGELPPAERAAAEAHLAACPACAAELRELRALHERAAVLLGRGDVPAPVAQATMTMRARRLRAGRYAEARRTLARAAVLVLALVGAAAAMPGTGVREWFTGVVLPERKAPQHETIRPAAPAPERPAPPEALPPEVSIYPDAGAVRVELTRISGQVKVRAQLVDGDLASVQVRGPAAAGARFHTSPGKIEVVGARAGMIEVRLPRAARAASVKVNGRMYVAKDGDALRVLAPATDEDGEGPVFRVGG